MQYFTCKFCDDSGFIFLEDRKTFYTAVVRCSCSKGRNRYEKAIPEYNPSMLKQYVPEFYKRTKPSDWEKWLKVRKALMDKRNGKTTE